MSIFWYTSGTMQKMYPDYYAYEHFSPLHLCVIAICLFVIIAAVIVYRRLNYKGKQKFLYVMAALLIADELFKQISTIMTGQWEYDYIPLHLCSINIFVCVINSFKRDDTTSEILYSLCAPGAILALLMPTWTRLPLWNGMSLHSNTVHLLLLLYPILLVSGGFRPDFRRLPKVLVIALCECVPIYFLNKLLDTNFFFLNGTSGNPVLKILVSLLGKDFYFLGFIPIVIVLWFVMYFPWYLSEKKSAKAV